MRLSRLEILMMVAKYFWERGETNLASEHIRKAILLKLDELKRSTKREDTCFHTNQSGTHENEDHSWLKA